MTAARLHSLQGRSGSATSDSSNNSSGRHFHHPQFLKGALALPSDFARACIRCPPELCSTPVVQDRRRVLACPCVRKKHSTTPVSERSIARRTQVGSGVFTCENAEYTDTFPVLAIQSIGFSVGYVVMFANRSMSSLFDFEAAGRTMPTKQLNHLLFPLHLTLTQIEQLLLSCIARKLRVAATQALLRTQVQLVARGGADKALF